jgi:hypothetical protein
VFEETDKRRKEILRMFAHENGETVRDEDGQIVGWCFDKMAAYTLKHRITTNFVDPCAIGLSEADVHGQ